MQRSRAEVLASPWLWLAIVVTALNDHLLKDSHAGWVTGKLSDVAGVAMLALLAAAVAGRRWPVVVVGAAFVALKTVPGVAGAAAPLLGGTTLRDPTDLVALAVLVPVWAWLSRAPRPTGDQRPAMPAGVLAAIQVLGVGAAITVTSATSCVGGSGVAEVTYDQDFRAVVADGGGNVRQTWTSSDGRAWTRSGDVDPTAPPTSPSPVPTADELPSIELGDGTMLTLRENGVTERAPSGATTVYRADQVADGTCADDPAASYQSVATDGAIAVVAMGENGVSVRSAAGEWQQVAVGESDPGKTARATVVSVVAGVVAVASLIAYVAAIVLAATARRRRAVLVPVTAVTGLGVLVVQAVSWVIISIDRRQDDLAVPLIVWCVVSVAVWTGVHVSLAARRRQASRDGGMR